MRGTAVEKYQPSLAQEATRSRYWDSAAERAVNIFVDWPCACFWSCCSIMLVASALSVALGMISLADQDYAWMVWEAEATQAWRAIEYAKDDADPIPSSSPTRRLPLSQGQNAWKMEMLSDIGSTRLGGRVMQGSSRYASSFSSGTWSEERPGPRRMQDDEDDGSETLYLFYKAGGSVFNPASLKAICELEQYLRSRLPSKGDESAELVAAGWLTPLNLFYGSPSSAPPAQRQLPSTFTCVELPEANITETVRAMHADVQVNLSSSVYARFVHPAFVGSMESPVTSTVIDGPRDIVGDLAEDVLDRLGLKYGFLRSAYQGDDDQFTSLSGGTRIRVAYTDVDEFSAMILMDLGLALFSFIFVFLVMYAYTGSLFLASFGMLQILLSLPLAGLLYKGVFQITYFETVHVLVVYLVLGVGADDIFVLVDTFKHIDSEKRGQDTWTKEGLRQVLKAAYMRSASAIFNTSFTTMVAFLASSGSKVMPMRTCGWFAATCIFMNFMLTISFTPVLVVLWHTRFQGKRCCSLDWAPRQEKSGVEVAVVPPQPAIPDTDLHDQQKDQQWTGTHDELAIEDGRGSAVDATELEAPFQDDGAVKERRTQGNIFERIIARTYLPFMSTSVDLGYMSIRPGSLLVVLTMLAVAIQGAIFALQLTPPQKPPSWLPDNHMVTGFSEFSSSVSISPDHEMNTIIGVFWGIEDLDTSGLDVYKPDDFKGNVIFDGDFDLSDPAAQDVVLATCEKIRNLLCTKAACRNEAYGTRTLMMQTSEKSWSCFLEDFRDYIIWRDGNDAWPLAREQFNSELMLFRTNASGEEGHSSGCCQYGKTLEKEYQEDIGFIGGELKYVQIRIRSTVAWSTPFGKGVDVRDLLNDWIDAEVRSVVAGMGSVKFHAHGLFADYDMGEELVKGLFQGVAIALPIAFVILLTSTWNIVVAFYAVSCVGAIVLSVLGFCKSAMDWDLGVAESIAGVIVLGYSVDYVVHLSHMYCEGGSHHGLSSRGERAAFAIANMGSTVFAGAITTAGSALVMYFCFITFFPKMATLITVTIMYAFLCSLGLFMGLLWIAGPEGSFGDLAAIFNWVWKGKLDQASRRTQKSTLIGHAETDVAREDDVADDAVRSSISMSSSMAPPLRAKEIEDVNRAVIRQSNLPDVEAPASEPELCHWSQVGLASSDLSQSQSVIEQSTAHADVNEAPSSVLEAEKGVWSEPGSGSSSAPMRESPWAPVPLALGATRITSNTDGVPKVGLTPPLSARSSALSTCTGGDGLSLMRRDHAALKLSQLSQSQARQHGFWGKVCWCT